jgi:hypothetical protein
MRWRKYAACAGVPVDVFFVERGASTAPAMDLCRACPVLGPCRRWALSSATAPAFGIVAAMTERTRSRLRRERGAPSYLATLDLPLSPASHREKPSEPRTSQRSTVTPAEALPGSWEPLHAARRARAAAASAVDVQSPFSA